MATSFHEKLLKLYYAAEISKFPRTSCACFGSTYTKIGTIQRRLAWPLRKDDTQNREAFHIFVTVLYIAFLIKTQITRTPPHLLL